MAVVRRVVIVGMHATLVLVLAGAASILASTGQDGSAPAAVLLGVDGRTNASPSIEALGSFVAVAWGAGTRETGSDVFVAVSRDGGSRFDPPVRVNETAGEGRLGGELPPRLSLRRVRGLPHPEITVLWTARGAATTIKLARSRDGGKSFGPEQALSTDAPGDRGWPALAADGAGNAHAIWLDHRGLAGHKSAAHTHKTASAADGAVMAQRSGLYFASTGTPRRPERELVKGVCYCCKTALVAGNNGTLYAAWRHVYPGNIRDIAFSTSRDGGRSFSAPQRVSEDGWEINACPDDGPAMAVDDRGTVHIVWPTVMVADGALEGAIFYATTRDGRTFTRRARVPTAGSIKPSHPQIVVGPSGDVLVAWDEVLDGRRGAYARTLRSAGAAVPEFGPIRSLSGELTGAYPALARTAGGFVAAWTSGASGGARIAVRPISAAGR
jgi:hypothetical protein